MYRVVLDPGVIVSAAISPSGPPRAVLDAVLDGRCTLIVSPALLAELDEVLRRPKFRRYISMEGLAIFVALVAATGELHEDDASATGLTRDPDDDYLLALGQATHADYVVSGDADLVELEGPRPPVLTPRAFLQLLSRSE